MPIKDPEARKEYQREYAQRNRDKAYERVKKWRAANPGARTKEAKAYREKYPEKAREKALKWKRANPEKAAQVSKKTRQKNRSRVIANKAIYRATKYSRTPNWLTEDDRWMIREIYALAVLRTKMLGFPWHVDHIIPLRGKNVCGLHVPRNLQVIPGVENTRKNNKFEVDNAK